MVAQSGIHYGDSLSNEINDLPPATLILTNPPFGTKKGGGLPSRTDFLFPTSNKQLCFLQHAYRWLRHGGRAAIVLPDNVLFEGNVGKQVRADLMDKCNLHTILRLPTGIFYLRALRLTCCSSPKARRHACNTGKFGCTICAPTCPPLASAPNLTRTHFAEFEAALATTRSATHRA
jgi:type I restriction enzyme M protein